MQSCKPSKTRENVQLIEGLEATRIVWCPGSESNRYDSFESRDFKSRASASFATRATRCSGYSLQELLHYHVLSFLLLGAAGVSFGVSWTFWSTQLYSKSLNRG